MLRELKTEAEIHSFFEELKKIAVKAFAEGRKVEHQHFSSIPPIIDGEREMLGVNTLQINIWDKILTFEQLGID
ncbi:MAG: hypothetical protein EOO91_01345 [Pedobacter sp.]|nr:MAG: hypothetical protein EOO91_01345 [Pedobacter sp.]